MKWHEFRKLMEPILRDHKIEFSISKCSRLVIRAIDGDYVSISIWKSDIESWVIRQIMRRIWVSVEELL